MKKWIKILIGIVVTPVLLFLILLVAYILINRQGVIEPFQFGNSNAENKILIASQGSDFKNNLVEKLVNQFKDDNNFLSVIDCTELGDENEKDWDAVIIIHTMQIHKMPKEARKFLAEVKDLSRIMLVSTSGGGDDLVTDFDVDAISSPSRTSVIPQILEWVNEKMVDKLNNESLLTIYK
ncbi:MAG: hypothetical protein K8R74_12795 [Bacteroidales bacterium]|nr:hypothetical protein [Bacteroidales bacterium]